MSNILELAGRRALVTGATKGVGHAVAARLREAGAAVLGTARARPADLSAEELFVTANVATAEGCAAVADAVMKQFGGIDIVVHVVGGSSHLRAVSPCSMIRSGSGRSTLISSPPCGWIARSCQRC